MDKESCANCRYWLADSERMQRGKCRRYPPTVKNVSTTPDEWCGEFSKRSGDVAIAPGHSTSVVPAPY